MSLPAKSIPGIEEHEAAHGFTVMCEACGWNAFEGGARIGERRGIALKRARRHLRAACSARLAEQKVEQERLQRVYAQFPSCGWGEREWYIALCLRPDIMVRLADDMGEMVAASADWSYNTARMRGAA